MKIRFDGQTACEILIYVDDGRVVGPNEELCWRETRRATSILNSLGIHDSDRKHRFPSQNPGLWTGNLVNTTSDIRIGISQE